MINEGQSKSRIELPILAFESVAKLRVWLAKNHEESNGIWLRIFKKDSGQKTVTYIEALDAALCYGWIDGLKNKYDDESWLQKFSPRRPKSLWSKRNTEHAERLIKSGEMKPAGFCEIEAAKKDGRWEHAYDSPGKLTVSEDFLKVLAKNMKAKEFFNTLSKANIYSITWRLQTAKNPETREKRIKVILEMLEQHKKFHE